MLSRGKGRLRPVAAHIEQSRCARCSECTVGQICPRDAVVPDPSRSASPPASKPTGFTLGPSSRKTAGPTAWKVEESKCSGCLLCAPYCPHKAVEPRERGCAA